jgi:predicted ATPase
VGETAHLFPVLWGLWVFYFVRAEYKTVRELGEQLFALAQNVQDPALLLEAHSALGQTFSYLGEFSRAHAYCAHGIALYDPRQHRSLAFLYGEDAGVVCLFHAAWNLWYLGYPDQALKRIDDALALAQELSHFHSLAEALLFAAMLRQFRREVETAQEQTETAITLSTEQGFSFWLGVGTILRGWALAEQEQAETGIAQIHQGLGDCRATGAEWARAYFLSLLAEVYGKAGQTEEELTMLAEALATVDRTGERFYEAELYRLKGTLTLQSQASPRQVKGRSRASQNKTVVTDSRPLTPELQGEAETYFLKAIDIACKQQAKSLELRATTSLARLWQQQGKTKQAHQMLSEIYNWFTEGFDTKDLQKAKALLGELSH